MFPLSLYLAPSIPFSLSLSAPASLLLLVLEGEVPRVETGPRQGPEHFCPVGGSGGQQGFHTGCDVLQVSTAHLARDKTQEKMDVNEGGKLKIPVARSLGKLRLTLCNVT